MIDLDIRTLAIILVVINAFLTLMMGAYWVSQKTYEGFSMWVVSLLTSSLGFFLLSLRGIIPDLLSIPVSNTLLITGIMFRTDSVLRFLWSRPMKPWYYGLTIPVFLLFSYFTFVQENFLVRNSLNAYLTILALLVTGFYALGPGKNGDRTIRLSLSGSLVGAAAFVLVRNWYYIGWYPGASVFSGDVTNMLLYMALIISTILSTGFFLMLHMARSQSELRSSEERYRHLSENLPDYVVLHDGDRILYANPSAAAVLGTDPEDMVGKSLFRFLTEKSALSTRDRLAGLMAGSKSVPPGEIDILLPGGATRHCITKTTPVTDGGERVFLSVITDITEQKRAENALFQANQKLKILSSITRHDIKNQLTALAGYLEISKMTVGDPVMTADFIAREQRIAGTIGRQIDFTRIYQDLGTMAPAWQDVGMSFSRAAASLPMREVRTEIGVPGLEVYADPLFEKVSYNLVENALRHGGPGLHTIRVFGHETEDGYLLVCEDDGAGISDSDRERIFESGFGKNTGFGLFLTREILGITGIAITGNSTPGQGARFQISIPRGSYRFRDSPPSKNA